MINNRIIAEPNSVPPKGEEAMAVSSTTAPLCLPANNIPPTPQLPKFGFSSTIRFTLKPPRLLRIRSSSAETSDTDVDSESSIEIPKEPSSLISALNVERILRGLRKFFRFFIHNIASDFII